MERKHTPLPWIVGDFGTSGPTKTIAQNYPGGRKIAECKTDETGFYDAAFIARACNSHYELVEALESALKYLSPSKGFADLDRAVFVIREALAKAKGEA